MRRTIASFLRPALVVLAALAAGTALAEPYPIGDRTLQLPPPPNLVRVSDSLPALMKTFESYAPAESRVVDAYLSAEDHAAFRADQPAQMQRYAQLAVHRASEVTPMSATGFRANLAMMERALEQTMPTIADRTREQTTRGNAEVERQYGVDVDARIGAVGFHGVHRREDWGLFFTATMDVTTNVEPANQRLFVASAMALVDNRFMTFNVYAEDEGRAHRWAMSTLDTWVDATRQANPDDPGRELRAVLQVGAISRTSLLAATAVTVIGAAVVIVVLRRRRRPGRNSPQEH